MTYIGNNLTIQQYAPQIAYFSGNGSTTVFTLPQAVVSSAQILVFVANVPQNPSSAYTVSNTTLTFTSAPPTGTNNVWVEYTSLQTNTVAPSPGTVNSNSFGGVTSIPFTGFNSIGTGDSSGMKNRIINGAMVIDQRNAGASVIVTADGQYTLDRFRISQSQNSKFTIQQSTVAPTGFTNSLLTTVTSAVTPSGSDFFGIVQPIEGYNVADLGFGTVNANTVTLSFWVRSSLTGTFSGMLYNNAANRSFCFTYTINSANTWELETITIPGDTSGTWTTNNTTGLAVYWDLGSGVNTGTANSWQSTIVRRTASSVQLVANAGATWQITGVQLEVGLVATGFQYRQYGTELALAQRYYEQETCPIFINARFASGVAQADGQGSLTYKTSKRALPTTTVTYVNNIDNSTSAAFTATNLGGFNLQVNISNTTFAYASANITYKANSEL